MEILDYIWKNTISSNAKFNNVWCLIMSVSSFPEPSEDQLYEWAQEISAQIKKHNFDSYDYISHYTRDFFERKYSDYAVHMLADNYGESNLVVRKRAKGEDGMFDMFLGVSDEPQTEDELSIEKIVKRTYVKVLELFHKENPANFTKKLKEMELKSFKKIPEPREQAFNYWVTKIMVHYKLRHDTPLEVIIRNIANFFNILFPDYSFTYFKPKNEKVYPITIDRKYESSGLWMLEIDSLLLMVYNVHIIILKRLKRLNESPEDPNFWFDLVRLHEKMGTVEEADEYGDRGLSLDPKDLNSISMLVTLYAEKKQFIRGLKYFKRSGLIFRDKNMLPQALDIWKRVTQFEPNNKENWLILADIYDRMGNSAEADRCRDRVK